MQLSGAVGPPTGAEAAAGRSSCSSPTGPGAQNNVPSTASRRGAQGVTGGTTGGGQDDGGETFTAAERAEALALFEMGKATSQREAMRAQLSRRDAMYAFDDWSEEDEYDFSEDFDVDDDPTSSFNGRAGGGGKDEKEVQEQDAGDDQPSSAGRSGGEPWWPPASTVWWPMEAMHTPSDFAGYFNTGASYMLSYTLSAQAAQVIPRSAKIKPH